MRRAALVFSTQVHYTYTISNTCTNVISSAPLQRESFQEVVMARPKRDKDGYFYEVIELKRGPGGKRQRKFIRAKTAALLREKIAAFHAAQEQGFAPVRSSSEHTVASWMREWLASIKRRGKIRPSTYRRYEMDMRNH